jgi:hypothetical protein
VLALLLSRFLSGRMKKVTTTEWHRLRGEIEGGRREKDPAGCS